MSVAIARIVGEFDYVVVGAGSAGCVLANRLSADPDISVCLLEAGGSGVHPWTHIPIGYLYTMGNPRTDWMLKTEPDRGLNGRALNYPRGRGLGGSTLINGMIYMRGQAADYDHWRQLGNAGWGWDDVLPHFKAHEDFFAGESPTHGAGGEWRVESPRVSWEILDAFAEACVETGLPRVADFNGGDNEGVGYFHVNQRRGARWSAAKGFLKPAMGRPNLTVITHARAMGLQFQGARCVGVSFDQNGEACEAEARGEVILSAGAVISPQLLQLSGIGPPDLLAEHGIETRLASPGVGENLQDHLQIRAIYKITGVPTMNEMAASLWRKAWMGLEYALFRRGPLTMAPSQLGAFAKSDPARATPNLQYHVQPLSLDAFGEPLHPFPAFTASVCNLRPESRGHVRIRSADPRVAPAIRPNYLSEPADRKVAADSLRLTRRIVLETEALAKYRPEEFKPGSEIDGPEIDGDETLARAAGDISTTIFHPVSTARMGVDEMAVVDPRLRVHGVQGLRVVDASVMPTITSGNTNAPTMMIAEKAAAMIREDRRG